ncbi:1,4-alpha-glucan branching enzyme [Prolixibacter bellariivorans]|uniref:1,4-alpha-glucan branching enzyme n=1 Tax=Prolixibacter bellariivorans TaxID=314319 RepID=A0A5M4AYU1_9BACT|nr:alpha amylase C-terminal domain-containing protein [Prolixibacter bellariivorans]GET33069.1 1,4-alpha-glucan branching enzyme [Prolixibacter bellariivorans]
MMEKIPIVENDPWLEPFEGAFIEWKNLSEKKEKELTGGKSLAEFAEGHHYFGLFRDEKGWVLREWAPNATRIFLTGTFNDWKERPEFELHSIGNGNWELRMSSDALQHGDLFALSVYWEGGQGKRIPAWTRRAVQDPDSLIFNAEVWMPEHPYEWRNEFSGLTEAPLVYESHVGMAGEEPRIHTYEEFRTTMLPRIKKAGYNTIQLMAVPEHPYYGSFGYHVSGFFAPSSRFGTPDELKVLIDEAHGMGMAVIMDLVHSHAVKNEVEGLGRFDGTRYQFFHEGGRGEHPAWDSYCFNYGKPEVLHFLFSNIKYWLDEFQFDGFRFDGVTSMLYLDHGLEKAFSGYGDYFTPNLDYEAIVYFKLANKLIHQIKPNAISIAEEVSGMPGLASPQEAGGFGFDFRMAMGVPDYWIKVIKERKDEDWDVGQIFYELTAHRQDEKVVAYAESHDQALVGDKTIIFRLIDKEMYFSMRKDQPNLKVERGIALHKMIRLATASCAGGAYLNFMGNEFGHPEWIDFPREGNGWSYQHARRIWSIAEDPELRYHWLQDFDRDMINILREERLLELPDVRWITDNKADQVLAYQRGDLLFVFNFNPDKSFEGYGIQMEPSKFKVILSTDAHPYGGQNRIDQDLIYYTLPVSKLSSNHYLRLYLPARTAVVLKKESYKRVR